MDFDKYKGLSFWGFILYLCDRYPLQFALFLIMLLPAGVFCFIYYFAKDADIQIELFEMVVRLGCISWVTIGINIVVVLLSFLLLYTMRRHYKKEIHRLGTEKTKLQEELTMKKHVSSGHKEN